IISLLDATEEFFEYDAEEFLVFLTLLITEGRTPECSVKGRTEGLHCPPAQSAPPGPSKHECSDKLPQCRQARRTRSEVMLLWRNNIPIMIEVMLLPDCCYSDEGPTTDGADINDPAIKQDALLLERWTLQPVPRQSGDRFIEEKTLLLAVRSYVFFSQLSAWLSASHGIVPRNILYRISPADEELVWNFSQTPSEHAFPIPNVSQSVALKVRVQSLPRQPNYPVLKCSIHSGLTFFTKRVPDPVPGSGRVGDLNESPLFPRTLRSPLPHSPLNSRKCLQPEPLPQGKAVKWFYSKISGSPHVRPPEAYGTCTNGTESPKASGRESPVRAFKSLSLADPLVTPSPSPRPLAGETNPLIGSLLQERQEVIARIAQRLNFCDPTAPHIPDGLFTSPQLQSPKSLWTTARDEEGQLKKTKEPCFPSSGPQLQQHPQLHETSNGEGRCRPSPFDTPLSPRSRSRVEREPHTSPRPASCRRLLLSETPDTSLISEAVQDISRLIQERLQQSHSLLHCTYKLCKDGVLLKSPAPPPEDCSQSEQRNGLHTPTHSLNSTPCTSSEPTGSITRGNADSPQDSPLSPLKPCNNWKKQNRHSIDGTATKAFHPCTGLPLLSSPVPQRRSQTGYFDLDTSLNRFKAQPWATSKRACLKREGDTDEPPQQLLSASAPPASLSLLGNFEECVLNYRLEPLGTVEGFAAEVGASGTFCPNHMTFPVDVSFYSVSDDNAPSPYMGVINLESLGKRGYRVPPSGTIQVTLFNPNKTVVKMFVVMYDLREMPAGHQTFLRQRTFSVPVRRESNGYINKKPHPLNQGRTLRYLIHLRFQSSKSGKIYLHRDIRLLFSRKSMEVDSGAAYELKSFTESPADPPFSPRC
uniref:Atos homolog protein A n=1 Tax=Denticeps clupeoides TaxID=299321 RepID=A0AAY4B5H3_9TELE